MPTALNGQARVETNAHNLQIGFSGELLASFGSDCELEIPATGCSVESVLWRLERRFAVPEGSLRRPRVGAAVRAELARAATWVFPGQVLMVFPVRPRTPSCRCEQRSPSARVHPCRPTRLGDLRRGGRGLGL